MKRNTTSSSSNNSGTNSNFRVAVVPPTSSISSLLFSSTEERSTAATTTKETSTNNITKNNNNNNNHLHHRGSHPPPIIRSCPFCQRMMVIFLVVYAAAVLYLITQLHERHQAAGTSSTTTSNQNTANQLLPPLAHLRSTGAAEILARKEQEEARNPTEHKESDFAGTAGSRGTVPLSTAQATLLQQMEQHLAQTLADFLSPSPEGKTSALPVVHSCRSDSSSAQRYTYDDTCPSAASPSSSSTTTSRYLLYVNRLQRSRILTCSSTTAPTLPTDYTLPGQSMIMFPADQDCHMHASIAPPHLFPVIPNGTALGMPPVITRFGGGGGAAPRQFEGCDIPCLHAGSPGLICTRTVDSIDGGLTPEWQLTFSMEGPQYYEMIRIDPTAYRRHMFYSTTSYQSEVPLPYYSWAEYKIHVPPLDYDTAIKGAVFLARNCQSRNNREAIIRQLQELSSPAFRVDSLSSCLHNAEPGPGINLGDKRQVMQHYLFYLAFENQCEPDYITEKLWGPMEAGTVPVYFGAPNVHDHVPNQSIIAVQDFASTADLAAYLAQVAQNKTLYQSYTAWRSQPLPPHFHAKYDFTHIHSTCRTCRWAYARQYGWGWDHYNQSLRELYIPRRLCWSSSSSSPDPEAEGLLVDRPFREDWLVSTTKAPATKWRLPRNNSASGTDPSQDPCSSRTASDRTLLVGNGMDGVSLQRTVHEVDGVIDMHLKGLVQKEASSDLILRLDTLLTSTNSTSIRFLQVEPGHIRLQDDKSRYTLLSSPPLNVQWTDKSGKQLDVVIPLRQLPIRLRIIVEDVDTLHHQADQEENYFATLMMDDFFRPVEAFTVELPTAQPLTQRQVGRPQKLPFLASLEPQ